MEEEDPAVWIADLRARQAAMDIELAEIRQDIALFRQEMEQWRQEMERLDAEVPPQCWWPYWMLSIW